MPIAKHRSPSLTWRFELPDKLKLAIADAIVLYSRIESCIVEIVWELEQPDLERKKEIAKAWGDQNFRFVKRAVKLIPGAKTDAIWPALKAIGKERNIIGHGVWMWTNEERPLVVWHSKFLEEADWVGAEFFDFARFDYFMQRAELLMNTFARFKQLLVQAIETEKASRAGGASEPEARPWWRKPSAPAVPKHRKKIPKSRRVKKTGPRKPKRKAPSRGESIAAFEPSNPPPSIERIDTVHAASRRRRRL
jgi:hypothetical protein